MSNEYFQTCEPKKGQNDISNKEEITKSKNKIIDDHGEETPTEIDKVSLDKILIQL